MNPIIPLIEWIRARDKKRYGKWITHNTAKGSVNDLLSALDAAGFVVVPKEPSKAMRIAALNTDLPGIGEPPLYEKIYRAMISAAQDKP